MPRSIIKKTKLLRPVIKPKRKAGKVKPLRPVIKPKRKAGRVKLIDPFAHLRPNITIKIEPVQLGKATFLPLAANASNKKGSTKIVLRLELLNKTNKALKVNSINFSFPNSKHPTIIMKDKEFGKRLTILRQLFWSNRRLNISKSNTPKLYDNAIYLKGPAPKRVQVNVYCKGKSHPATKLVGLKAHKNDVNKNSYSFPFSAADLMLSQFCVTKADHKYTGGAGATQMFAHDITVQRVKLKSKKWTPLKAHENVSLNKNEDHGIWNLPVRAMANGTVQEFLNTMKDNTKMGKPKPAPKPVFGNYLKIKHGKELVTYSHFKKGSIPKSLLKKGARVREGQIIGLGGNSGNSSGPHLHIHVIHNSSEALRPFLYRDAWTIQKNKLSLGSTISKWTQLKGHGIPFEDTVVWPNSSANMLKMLLHVMSNF